MDFDDAPLWEGREAHHRAAIDAARKVGVNHIYYTSLGFGNPSKAAVMRAHVRTEAYLQELEDVEWTIIREGLYNESWPLYFGYYYGLKNEKRGEVVVPGDGPISWTAIADMAFGTAQVLAAPAELWAGKTFYLSQNRTWTLHDIANIVSRVRGEEVKLKIVDTQEWEEYYIQKKEMERPAVEWWGSSYEAISRTPHWKGCWKGREESPSRWTKRLKRCSGRVAYRFSQRSHDQPAVTVHTVQP
jgi:uncharacterized protein YbjT (DUF2867 family)